MEVTIPVPAVKAVLAGVSKVLRTRSIFPECGYVWVQPTTKGVNIIYTNFDEHLLYECPDAICDGEQGFFLEYSSLRSFMQVIRGDTVSIVIGETALKMKFYEDMWAATVEMPLLEAEPKIDIENTFNGWETQKPGTFFEDYVFALPFMSNDMTRAALNGVCFTKTGDVVATDGRRIVVKKKGHSLNIPPHMGRAVITGVAPQSHDDLIVPNTRFLRTLKADKVDGIQITPEHDLRVSLPGWKYVTKCVDASYPNYGRVIPDTAPEPYFELGDNAIAAFRFIETLSSARETPVVKINPLKTKAKLTITAENHTNQKKVTVDMDGCGDGTIKTVSAVNPHYFIEALERGFRRFHQQDRYSPLVSHCNGWTHVLMPMRVAD